MFVLTALAASGHISYDSLYFFPSRAACWHTLSTDSVRRHSMIAIMLGREGGTRNFFHRSPYSLLAALSGTECAFYFTIVPCGCWFLTWVDSLYGLLLHERQCGGRLWRVSHLTVWHDALYQIHAGVERELLTGHKDAPDTAPHSWNWYWLEPFEINHYHYGTILYRLVVIA
jgi:hypothetical protein